MIFDPELGEIELVPEDATEQEIKKHDEDIEQRINEVNPENSQ